MTSRLRLTVAVLLCSTFPFLPALHAQRPPQYTFTVLTNAGVNLRKGPGTEHAKIVPLPFGTVVDAKNTDQMLLCQEQDTMPPGCIKIEGRRGYWMEVTHKNVTGYVFSGFGWLSVKQESPQYIFKTPDSPILDYQLLQLGLYCYNDTDDEFDPRLNWYGLKEVNSRLEWVKVNARIWLGNEFVFQADSGEEHCGFRVVCDEKGAFLMLGLRPDLSSAQLKAISSSALRFPGHGRSKEIRRDERFAFEWGGVPYELHGFKLKSKRIVEEYGNHADSSDIGLELRIGKGSNARFFDLAKMMGIRMDWERREDYHDGWMMPELNWAGDINQDGQLDMLFWVMQGREGCGSGWTYTLILGKKSETGIQRRGGRQGPWRNLSHAGCLILFSIS